MPSIKTLAASVAFLAGPLLAVTELTDLDPCAVLSISLPGKVSYPNSSAYELSNTYWSEQQSEVHPACFVTPTSSVDVSTALTQLIRMRKLFTVKGGGHTAFTGGSNIEDGVTIDMALMNHVVVSEDKQTVSVGPGSRWIDISKILDPMGLAVVAGRVSDVGVPGLALGGGISYFSGMYGWVCDNVREYEIVVASGKVLTASPTENQDLYWALRGGGGSNFGIVTRFDLMAFEQGDLWEQALVMPGVAVDAFLPLYQDLAANGLAKDPEAHTFFAYSYIPALGGYSGIANFYHATYASSSAEAATTIPDVFHSLQAVPSIVNTTSVANITTRSIEIREAYGSRQTWWDATLKATEPQLFVDIVPLFQEMVSTMNSTASEGGAPEITSYLVFQPISINILEQMQKNGGNALGTVPEDGPLMIMQLSSTWEDPAVDSLVETQTKKTLDAIVDMAAKRGLLHPFKYMNYAGREQNVFAGYGSDNEKRLKKIAKQYDGQKDLQKYWKGYFQISD